jgi:hypothetical protein
MFIYVYKGVCEVEDPRVRIVDIKRGYVCLLFCPSDGIVWLGVELLDVSKVFGELTCRKDRTKGVIGPTHLRPYRYAVGCATART